MRARREVTRGKQRVAVLVTALAALLFLAGTFAVPALESAGSSRGALLRLVYAPLCHQSPERGLSVTGGVQAVCARCSGLYVGGTIGLFSGLLLFVGTAHRPRPLWLALAVAPTVVDAALSFAGLPALANLPRWVVAVPAGLVAGWFLAVGVADLFGPRPSERDNQAIPVRTPRALEEIDG
jgi:uncharacterized membrane protein